MRKERLAATRGGWVLYRSVDPTVTAWIRFEERGARLVAVDLSVAQGIDTDTLRTLPFGRIDAWANSPDAKHLREWLGGPAPNFAEVEKMNRLTSKGPAIPELGLDVPAGRADYGDDFYKKVAQRYTSAAWRVRAPAAALAEANGVPVTTARRWVKEARTRGFLPAGRAGKAG